MNVKNGEVEDLYGLLIGLLDRVSDITTIFPGEYTTFTLYRIDLDNENALDRSGVVEVLLLVNVNIKVYTSDGTLRNEQQSVSFSSQLFVSAGNAVCEQ